MPTSSESVVSPHHNNNNPSQILLGSGGANSGATTANNNSSSGYGSGSGGSPFLYSTARKEQLLLQERAAEGLGLIPSSAVWTGYNNPHTSLSSSSAAAGGGGTTTIAAGFLSSSSLPQQQHIMPTISVSMASTDVSPRGDAPSTARYTYGTSSSTSSQQQQITSGGAVGDQASSANKKASSSFLLPPGHPLTVNPPAYAGRTMTIRQFMIFVKALGKAVLNPTTTTTAITSSLLDDAEYEETLKYLRENKDFITTVNDVDTDACKHIEEERVDEEEDVSDTGEQGDYQESLNIEEIAAKVSEDLLDEISDEVQDEIVRRLKETVEEEEEQRAETPQHEELSPPSPEPQSPEDSIEDHSSLRHDEEEEFDKDNSLETLPAELSHEVQSSPVLEDVLTTAEEERSKVEVVLKPLVERPLECLEAVKKKKKKTNGVVEEKQQEEQEEVKHVGVEEEVEDEVKKENGIEEVEEESKTDEAKSEKEDVEEHHEPVPEELEPSSSDQLEEASTYLIDEQDNKLTNGEDTVEINEQLKDDEETQIEEMEPDATTAELEQEECGESEEHQEPEASTTMSIATFHDLGAATDTNRLTESELMLGKMKPYWIPDADRALCMLCDLKFSLLLRRHHCRACGRVLCAACCSDKAHLQYMQTEDSKPVQARVCTPCSVMLAKIEEYEKNPPARAEGSSEDSRVKGVLKNPTESGPSTSEGQEKRSVMFRDGVKPGTSSTGETSEQKCTAVKPKKKSRKRLSVVRRITELKLEEELRVLVPSSIEDQLLVVLPTSEQSFVDQQWASDRLKDDLPVTVMLMKNLRCDLQIVKLDESTTAWCVVSNGFSIIGQDEVMFSWIRNDTEDFYLPLNVLHRIIQVYRSCCENDSSGVRYVINRLPAMHSSDEFKSSPLTKHIYFFPPTNQDLSRFPIPSSPFRIACFVHPQELSWMIACPNRVLLRLGLRQSWYPIPVVNEPDRKPTFTGETSQTVLKVFTDFRNWSYRMEHVVGCTVTLKDNTTTIEVPRSSKEQVSSIVSFNKNMLAWCCDINTNADSHLVCDETEPGFYSTQVLAKSASRQSTGASFIIVDGGLKSTSKVLVNVVEDGIAVRMQPETFSVFLNKLNSKEEEDFEVTDAQGTEFAFRWVDGSRNASPYAARSPIDNSYLGDLYQYGLSLERALTAVLHISSCGKYGVALSHVYNMNYGRMRPEEEPRLFSVAEMIGRETATHLDAYINDIVNMDMKSISVRVIASRDSVEYVISEWPGLEDGQKCFKQNLDRLVSVIYELLDYFPTGFNLEITLSFIQMKVLEKP